MKRLILIAAASAALAGAAHATTDAGTAPPTPAGFIAMSNVQLMAQRSGVLLGANVLVGNGRVPSFSIANEPGLTSGGILPPPVLASGGPLATVPEPASWALLIAGFGLVGAVARRRRVATAA